MFGRRSLKRVENTDSEESVTADEEGFSLEELGSAYAEALEQTASKSSHASDPFPSDSILGDNPVGKSESLHEEMLNAPNVEESDGVPVTPESILEAMLFLGTNNNQPLSIAKLTEILRGVTSAELESSVDTLNNLYREHGRTMEIVRESGGYRMQLIPEMHIVRDRFYGKIKETQLTQSAIDCLALVAYQPGISRGALEKQWNQPAGNMLNMLVRKGLLRVEKSSSESNSSQYFTTDRFLETIGIESLQDLPHSEEI